MINTIFNKKRGDMNMDKRKRSEEYNKGYDDAEKDFLDKEKVKLFKEGYKAGFRDGYNEGMRDAKKFALEQMPPEIRKQLEEGGGQGIWWPW